MNKTRFEISIIFSLILALGQIESQTFDFTSVTDQTPVSPLSNPTPGVNKIRYITGLGMDNTFVMFFEDRMTGTDRFPINYLFTSTGPTGFPSSATLTNIEDTHFVIMGISCVHKDVEYDYRAWGSNGDDELHNFYVSDDLVTWVQASLNPFTIPNASGFSPRGSVYYGFHDIILINGTYYAIAEANSGECMLVRSVSADTVWEAFATIGGTERTDGPLQVPAGRTDGWKSSGSFVELGYDRGIGTVFSDPDEQYLYLAVNTEAKSGLSPALLEAAFIDSTNWNWHDGTKGCASNPILTSTSNHNYGETWTVPRSDIDANWIIFYTAKYGTNEALGYAVLSPPGSRVKLKLKILLSGPYSDIGDDMSTDLESAGYIPTVSPYDDERDAGVIPPDVVDWVFVQLREIEDGPVVAQRSFFVKNEGTVVETDGITEELTLTGAGEGDYYIIVRHRNHLAVMSKLPQNLTP